jgi:hypothetical protein
MQKLTKIAGAAALLLAATSAANAAAPARPTPAGAQNIIIVGDAFVDGSGWRVVHDILYWKGYNVTVVQPGFQSVQADGSIVDKKIFAANGPAVLVGHGYGGNVITAAGKVGKIKALVYVAGYAPDVAESANQLANSIPPEVDNVKYTFDGVAYYDPANFGRDWAGDLAENRTNYMAASQPFATIAALGGQSRTVAWRGIPSYGIVATDDRTINPDLQRWMYQRAGSKVTEVKASHAVYISQAEAVAKVIEEAALAAK